MKFIKQIQTFLKKLYIKRQFDEHMNWQTEKIQTCMLNFFDKYLGCPHYQYIDFRKKDIKILINVNKTTLSIQTAVFFDTF